MVNRKIRTVFADCVLADGGIVRSLPLADPDAAHFHVPTGLFRDDFPLFYLVFAPDEPAHGVNVASIALFCLENTLSGVKNSVFHVKYPVFEVNNCLFVVKMTHFYLENSLFKMRMGVSGMKVSLLRIKINSFKMKKPHFQIKKADFITRKAIFGVKKVLIYTRKGLFHATAPVADDAEGGFLNDKRESQVEFS